MLPSILVYPVAGYYVYHSGIVEFVGVFVFIAKWMVFSKRHVKEQGQSQFWSDQRQFIRCKYSEKRLFPDLPIMSIVRKMFSPDNASRARLRSVSNPTAAESPRHTMSSNI